MPRKARDPNAPVVERNTISMPMPSVLREKLKAEMPADSKEPLGTFIAKKLAALYAIVLPARRSRSRFTTAEERIASQKAQRLAKATLIKQLLAEHEAKMQAAVAEANAIVAAPAEAEAAAVPA